MKKLFTFIISQVFFLIAIGQLEYGGVPLSFSNNLSNDSVPIITLPIVSNLSLYDSIVIPEETSYVEYDSAISGYDTFTIDPAPVTWINRNVNTLLNSGYTYTLPNGNTIVRLAVISDSAESMNVTLTNFNLDSLSVLYVYSYNRQGLLGAYNQFSNNGYNTLITGFIPGDTLVIEYDRYDTSYNTDSMDINVTNVGHGIPKSLMSNAFVDCYINANCTNLCNQIRSNVYLELQLSDQPTLIGCSGVLLIDADQSLNTYTYVLTARHCIVDTNGDYAIVPGQSFAAVNFELTTCASGTYSYWDDNAGTPVFTGQRFIIPGTAISNNWHSDNGDDDLAILQFNYPLPIQWNPYYAGWDRVTSIADLPRSTNGHIDVTVISHPVGMDAKYAEGNIERRLTIQDPDKWFVNWNQSTTDHGSSGGGLFDPDNKVIGAITDYSVKHPPPPDVNCTKSNALCGKIGDLDAFQGVIATQYPSGNSFGSMEGVDPMLICQSEIDINGEVLDASLWRESNTGAILIEAENNILLNTQHSGTTFTNNCNYILQAGSEILFEPGNTYNPNSATIIQGNVNTVVATIHDCTPIDNTCQNFTVPAPHNGQDEDATIPLLSNTGFSSIIYPNPTAGNITIQANGLTESITTISVYNSLGNLVYSNNFDTNDTYMATWQVNNQNLAGGLYLVRVTNGDNSQVHKLVVATQ